MEETKEVAEKVQETLAKQQAETKAKIEGSIAKLNDLMKEESIEIIPVVTIKGGQVFSALEVVPATPKQIEKTEEPKENTK